MGMKRADVRARVEEAARSLRITELLDRPVSGLSGGDRQRVALVGGRVCARGRKPVGDPRRDFRGGRLFDSTACGDTINAAARLEAVNKQLGTRICVSAAAAERAGDFCDQPVGDFAPRGAGEFLPAYEPLPSAGGAPRRPPILRRSPNWRREIPRRLAPSQHWSGRAPPTLLSRARFGPGA